MTINCVLPLKVAPHDALPTYFLFWASGHQRLKYIKVNGSSSMLPEQKACLCHIRGLVGGLMWAEKQSCLLFFTSLRDHIYRGSKYNHKTNDANNNNNYYY